VAHQSTPKLRAAVIHACSQNKTKRQPTRLSFPSQPVVSSRWRLFTPREIGRKGRQAGRSSFTDELVRRKTLDFNCVFIHNLDRTGHATRVHPDSNRTEKGRSITAHSFVWKHNSNEEKDETEAEKNIRWQTTYEKQTGRRHKQFYALWPTRSKRDPSLFIPCMSAFGRPRSLCVLPCCFFCSSSLMQSKRRRSRKINFLETLLTHKHSVACSSFIGSAFLSA